MVNKNKIVAGKEPATIKQIEKKEIKETMEKEETLVMPEEKLSKEDIAKAIQEQFAKEEQDEKIAFKTVIIKATPTFVVTPPEVEDEAYVVISSPLKGRHVYVPLEPKEIAEVAQELFGFSTKDTDFTKQIRDYFASFRIKVEYGDGSENTGKHLTLPIDKEGNVIFNKRYVEDIIAYRICLESKKVAVTPNEVAEAKEEGESNFIAYLYDNEKDKIAQRQLMLSERQANIDFIRFTEDDKSKELDWLARIILRGVPLTNGTVFVPKVKGDIAGMVTEDKHLILSEFKSKHPTAFSKMVRDPNLEKRALIEQLIEIGTISRDGNVIKYGEQVLGANMNEALDELKKPSNSNLLVELKAAARI